MSVTKAIATAAAATPFVSDTLLSALGPLTIFPDGPTLQHEWDEDVGVWERYTLAVHTRYVLRQFETYFSDAVLPEGIRRPALRVALALHDAGKPEAIRCGSKRLQHEKTVALLAHVGPVLPLTPAELTWTQALIDGDPLGSFFRDRLTLDETACHIRQSASDSHLALETYAALLIIYYQCDASAYTIDAGGQPSLEKLFAPRTALGFPHTATGRRLRFNDDLEVRLADLRVRLGL